MTRFEHWGRAVSWLIIALAFLWLVLVAVPQFVDRVSRHVDTWTIKFEEPKQ